MDFYHHPKPRIQSGTRPRAGQSVPSRMMRAANTSRGWRGGNWFYPGTDIDACGPMTEPSSLPSETAYASTAAKPSSIIVLKVFSRSTLVVASWVTSWSLTVRMARASTPYLAARV